ncbi:MAG: hypothetical protein IJJ44_09760 [Solobacterium sp.]|nr:hypothetical protein [Solobacterium sp.]
MKKFGYIVAAIVVMLIVSRFVVRIIDATVQIGDDLGLLIVLLVFLNSVIGVLSCLFYRKTSSEK